MFHTPPKKNSSLVSSLLFALLVYFVSMSSSTPFVMSPKAEVLTFKQRGGESLKDAWYRINDAQNRSTKKHTTKILLRNFYVGVTIWYRHILDTLTGGIFLGAHTSEAYKAIKSLVGNTPCDDVIPDISMEKVLERLSTIEKILSRIQEQIEKDNKLADQVDKIYCVMQNIAKRIKIAEGAIEEIFDDLDDKKIDNT